MEIKNEKLALPQVKMLYVFETAAAENTDASDRADPTTTCTTILTTTHFGQQ